LDKNRGKKGEQSDIVSQGDEIHSRFYNWWLKEQGQVDAGCGEAGITAKMPQPIESGAIDLRPAAQVKTRDSPRVQIEPDLCRAQGQPK